MFIIINVYSLLNSKCNECFPGYSLLNSKCIKCGDNCDICRRIRINKLLLHFSFFLYELLVCHDEQKNTEYV